MYTTGDLGSVQNTVTYDYATGSWGDLLTSFNGQSIAYDGIGNPGTWNGSALTWRGRRLMSYGSNTYTYNADGIRTSKTVNGVEHIYHLSGTQILSEEWTEGSVQHILIYVYDASGNPIGMSHYENGATPQAYVFAKNIRGDIIGIYDSNGTRVVTYVYDAWGRILSTTGTGANTIGVYNPFRYRGYYYDTETSLYYLNSRYYDPNVGRFLNVDGSVNANGDLVGFNMFAYCSNNPVMYADYLGTDIYYDPEEPDWASAYTFEEIEIMREIGFEEFNKLPDEIQDELLRSARTGEYSDNWSMEGMSNELNRMIPHTTYSKRMQHAVWLDKMEQLSVWGEIPMVGTVFGLAGGLGDFIMGIHNRDLWTFVNGGFAFLDVCLDMSGNDNKVYDVILRIVDWINERR